MKLGPVIQGEEHDLLRELLEAAPGHQRLLGGEARFAPLLSICVVWSLKPLHLPHECHSEHPGQWAVQNATG